MKTQKSPRAGSIMASKAQIERTHPVGRELVFPREWKLRDPEGPPLYRVVGHMQTRRHDPFSWSALVESVGRVRNDIKHYYDGRREPMPAGKPAAWPRRLWAWVRWAAWIVGDSLWRRRR